MQTNHHVGRLSREVKFYLRGEKQFLVAYFSLAINDLKDGKVTYIDYVAFGKTAELVRDLLTRKGLVVEVDFNMRNHQYTKPETTEVVYEMQNVVNFFRIYGQSKTAKVVDTNQQSSSSDLPAMSNFDSADFSGWGGEY
ncbi:single-stranded DNA-binding protein [Leuconostoc citreum]|uniref:single-stranded DNA-binding protein n=1 Tax=Leuconostoc citreum TaxID=33964 RepID=UPI0020A071CA|nr:single-stranded DNA-binding protein [Leuconostoc citreum]MCP1275109.1 single-stranded DNA-binding protein [Leuconostoc citreum]